MSDEVPRLDGRLPDGMITEIDDDQGEILCHLTAYPNTKKVVIRFGKLITWIGFSPSDARAFAHLLLLKADEAEQELV